MKRRRRHVFRDRQGGSSVEFAIVAFLFFTAVLGVVDFARALWQWNLAAKATQIGVRVAVVSDLAARNLRIFDGTNAAPIGLPVPVGALSPNPVLCARGGCGAALDALDPALLDGAAFARIVAAMRAFDRRIGADNVVVEYRHVGLGLAGNPYGPDVDPIVTVRLRGMSFAFAAVAFLGLPPLAMPDFRASLPVEDGRGT